MFEQIRAVHATTEDQLTDVAQALDPGLFITQYPREFLRGTDACDEARRLFEAVASESNNLAVLEKVFLAKLNKFKDEFTLPRLGRRPKGAYPFAVIFKLIPVPATWAALKQATSGIVRRPPPTIQVDHIADARVGDEPLFEYFTNVVFVRHPSNEDRAVWFDFDLVAFIEAIKAPHRYYQDTQKREEAASKLRSRIAAIEGQGSSATDDDAESGSSFGFAEDNRIVLLRELVTDSVRGLAYLAEAEGISGGATEYTVQERTLRGWNAIRDKWRALAEKGEHSPEKLWTVVASEQAAHRDDFGSAMLYKKLTEPRHHPIWRDKATREWHADDPLRARLQYTELRLELEDKTRPIRFTSAHARYSPRYFTIPNGRRLAWPGGVCLDEGKQSV